MQIEGKTIFMSCHRSHSEYVEADRITPSPENERHRQWIKSNRVVDAGGFIGP
jgi:hypothetical protein